MKKSDLYVILTEIRERFFNSSTNRSLNIVYKIYMEGYLQGLRDTNFITSKELHSLIKEWCE